MGDVREQMIVEATALPVSKDWSWYEILGRLDVDEKSQRSVQDFPFLHSRANLKWPSLILSLGK